MTTSISPLLRPRESGKRIIKEDPVSDTVIENSVPLINTSAVGVFIDILCLSIFCRLPVTKRVVPNANVRAIFAFDGSGSKIYSSISSSLCSVKNTLLLSKNSSESRPLAVMASSNCCIGRPREAVMSS